MSTRLSNGQWRVAIVALGLVLASIGGCVFLLVSVSDDQMRSPTVQRLSLSIDREIDLVFQPTHFPPYQFLIGVKGASAECPPFAGTITVSGPDGMETGISIDSVSSQESNWLHNPSETGYILTWSKEPSLSQILVRGQSYRVRIRFQEPPPDGCSLWFSSMRHTPILGNEEARQ